MTQHGVDLAGVAGQQLQRAAAIEIAAACFDQQFLEIADVLINRRMELRIDPVAATDFLEGLAISDDRMILVLDLAALNAEVDLAEAA